MDHFKVHDPDGTNHFLSARCVECTGGLLSGWSLGKVEDQYHQGPVSQDAYEAYMHVWHVMQYAGYPCPKPGTWTEVPTNPRVLELVAAIKAGYELRHP